MCNLACKSSEFVMVDPWEANQSTYQRTLTVLSRIKTSLCESGLLKLGLSLDKLGNSGSMLRGGTFKVMLICCSDLIESFPRVWIRDQVRTICRDFFLVCIHRGGPDVEKIINDDGILNNFKVTRVHFELMILLVI
ncbi:hypothetical protein ACH5RR_019254 [Cinchona calisaya]|uniref:Cytidyltransferase-like domain-containing protein n=1 Tax=Cinchona calisaya TaxID=153742 RepID=A0ABD2ZNU3_9GENT